MACRQLLGKLVRLVISQDCRVSIERLVIWLANFRRASRLPIAMLRHRARVMIARTFMFVVQYLHGREERDVVHSYISRVCIGS